MSSVRITSRDLERFRIPLSPILSSDLVVTFGIEFEFYPHPSPDRVDYIPPAWYHQCDGTAGEEIATPVMRLNMQNLNRDYRRALERIVYDLRDYAERNDVTPIFTAKIHGFSQAGHIHIGTEEGIDMQTAKIGATYIKSIIPLTLFMAESDIFANFSRRAKAVAENRYQYAYVLEEQQFIRRDHYAMISYSAHNTIEVRVQDSAPPHVLVPVAYIYSTLFASALLNRRTAPRDYLTMTEKVIQFELKHAVNRRLRFAKIILRWLGLIRGDIELPKDIAILLWLALHRITFCDILRILCRNTSYQVVYRKLLFDSIDAYEFLNLEWVRRNLPRRLKTILTNFENRLGNSDSEKIKLTDLLKAYLWVSSDTIEKRVLAGFFLGNRSIIQNRLIWKLWKMAKQREWEIYNIVVRRMGERHGIDRYEDAQWISSFLANFGIDLTPEQIIEDRDRFYIIEKEGEQGRIEKLGVIRVSWRGRIVRGVWLERQLTSQELRGLEYALGCIADWFKQAVLSMRGDWRIRSIDSPLFR